MKRNLICYDSISCIRCYACMVNCAVENRARQFRDKNKRYELAVNETNKNYYYLTPEIYEYGKYPDIKKATKFNHCNHCENAPCMQICPSNAIEKRKSGAVVINEETCVGCRSCMDACPYNVPKYDEKSNKTFKCIFCYDRIENGLKQACVEGCPTGAMFSGTFDEVRAEVLKRLERYESIYNEPFVAYGLEKVNDYVGSLGWVTIIPKKELEAYKLPENPYRSGVALRNFAKKSAPVLIGAAVVATAGHFIYWLSKRKKFVEQSSKEEE